MADFSRNTFQLTNVLRQLLDGDTITDPRHYVGVRLQQAVPLLDADWNEADDVRRRELELLVRDFIGDGVPGLGEGFVVAQIEADNDFAIGAGAMLVGGWQVINPGLVNRSTLANVTPLTTPLTDRTDIVYLDTWEEERAADGADGDDRLVDPVIGYETAVRIERLWSVRVAENVAEFASLVLDEAGHKYTPLALLHRTASPRIQDHMIQDLRRRGLTLADGIKSPMFDQRGAEVLDATRYAEMLTTLRSAYRHWQETEQFPIVIASLAILYSYQNALNEIYNLASAAEISADAGNLNNADGIAALKKIVAAERTTMAVIRQFSTGIPADLAPIDLIEAHFDGDPARNLDGIQPALDGDDLLSAVNRHEALNEFLQLTSGDLPEGSVNVVMALVTPATPIAAGTPFVITYEVTSDLSAPATPESFDLDSVVSDVRWAVALEVAQVTLATGETMQIDMSVTPGPTLADGEFADINLLARAARRPSIVSTQIPQRFTIGENPPGETFFFYSGALSPVGGVLQIPRAEIEESILEIEFTLINSSGGVESHTFRLDIELVFPATLPVGLDPTQWIPNVPVALPGQQVPGAQTTAIASLRAPDLSAVSEDIVATLEVSATLTHINGTPISGGKSASISLPLFVDMT